MGASCLPSLSLSCGPGSRPGRLLSAAGRREDGESRAHGPSSDGLSSARAPLLARLPRPRHRRRSEGRCGGHPAEGRTPNTVPGTPGLKARSLAPKRRSPSLCQVCSHAIWELHVLLREARRGTPAFWTRGSSRRHRPRWRRRLARGSPPRASARPSSARTGDGARACAALRRLRGCF